MRLTNIALALRHGIRSAMRSPMFSVLAIVTLAFGIGANAALFAVIKPVLLDALPYTQTDRLVRIFGHNPSAGQGRWGVSAGMVDDLQRSQQSFASTAAFNGPQEVVIGGDDRARVGSVLLAEPNLFSVLGVEPYLGRATFTRDELPSSGPALYMILTYEAWQQYTGGDADIVGKPLSVFEVPRTVVGVLPQGFIGPAGHADIYMPLNLPAHLVDPISARRSYSFGLIGRLNPDVSVASARAELDAIAEVIQREHVEDVRGVGFNTVPLRTAMVGETRTPLLILLASAALVLIIACANLAGAMVSRALSRRKEFAVRAALGAGRGHLVRQLLSESTILALAGGTLGVVLAIVTLGLVRDLVMPALPHFAMLSLDPGTLAVILIITIGAGLAIGMLPALIVGGINPQQAMSAQARGATENRGSGRLRGLLVAAQIALCLGLLVSSGLLTRSLWGMSSAPVGVDSRNVVTARTTLPLVRYREHTARQQFHEALLQRLKTLPGVTDAATTVYLPMAVENTNTFEIEGRSWSAGQAEPWALWNAVSDDYFSTLRIPLLQGRLFDSRDSVDSPGVIVISEALARRYFPEAGDAIGAQVRIGPDVNSPRWEVIGVVGDVRNNPAEVEAQPKTYMSHRQEPVSSLRVVARTQGDPDALLGMIEQELFALDPALPFQEASTLDAVLSAGLAPRRLPVLLMIGFGGLALLLAAVGVYAMFAAMAVARERELGIRIALGATRTRIASIVVGQGAVWMGMGLLGGAALAVAAAYGLRDLLFGVRAFDPTTFGAAALLLGLAATLALLVPIRRAALVDPIKVLKSE